MSLQLDLVVDIGKEQRRCGVCGLRLKRKSCRICVLGEFPAPGTKKRGPWLDGVLQTVRKRLENVGLPPRVYLEAWDALTSEDRPMPEEAVPLLRDIMAMPIGAKAWQRAIDRVVIKTLVHADLCGDGVPSDEADRFAAKAADWAMARR